VLIIYYFFLFPGEATIILLAIGTGVAYGGFFGTVPTLMSLFFGTKHFGANYGFVLIAPALGTAGFGFMAGQLYQLQIEDEDSVQCYGESCYKTTFLITAIATALSAVLSVLLTMHRRKLNAARVIDY